MDEDEVEEQMNPPATDSSSSAKGRGRGRGRRRKCAGVESKRQSVRTPKWVAKFQYDDTWSLTEKKRLLEALRRYDPHNLGNITKLVGTKKEDEVERKIQSLKGIESAHGKSDKVSVVRGQEAAPIESWIDLVQEMTCYEPADYSQFIPKVLSLITRNEMFEDSGYKRLRWRNIYQFLTDLAEDRAELQQLSDMESLVILDLMHNLGDKLYSSDTSEQRRILDFKYNLLNFKCENANKAEKEIISQRIMQALGNDFWDPEDLPGKDMSNTSSVSSLTPSSSSSSSTTTHLQRAGTSSTATATAGPSSQTESNITTNFDPTVASTSGSGPSHVTNNVNPSTSGLSVNEGLSSAETDSLSPSVSGVLEGEDSNSQNSNDSERKLKRPLFFTLNPLCVPTQLLGFKQKSQDT